MRCKGTSKLLLAIGLVLAATPARAQPYTSSGVIQILPGKPWSRGVPVESRRRAYALFLEGNAIIRNGFFGKAADRYEAALDLWDHPAFHYNLGIAQMNLDRIVGAYQSFQAARRHGPRPIGEDKYEQAQVYLTLLGNQLAEIEVVCDEPGADVALDGKPLFRGPGRQRIMVRPGGHRAEASKPGRLSDVRQAVLDPGDRERVTLAPQLPAHLATTRRWARWIPWAVSGAGVLVLGGAGIMHQRSSGMFDEFDREFGERCPGTNNGCTKREIPGPLRARLDDAHDWQWAARVTYAAGSLTLVTSAALFFFNRERIVHERQPEGVSMISLEPMLTPRGAGVSAYVRF